MSLYTHYYYLQLTTNIYLLLIMKFTNITLEITTIFIPHQQIRENTSGHLFIYIYIYIYIYISGIKVFNNLPQYLKASVHNPKHLKNVSVSPFFLLHGGILRILKKNTLRNRYSHETPIHAERLAALTKKSEIQKVTSNRADTFSNYLVCTGKGSHNMAPVSTFRF